MEKKVVVIIGNDKYFCKNLISYAKFSKIKFLDTPDKNKGIQLVGQYRPDLVIITAGAESVCKYVEIIELIKRVRVETPVFFVSQKSSEDIILSVLRAGGDDFFKPPFSYSEIASKIKKTLKKNRQKGVQDGEPGEQSPFIGQATTMRRIRQYIDKVAPLDTTVFITGETGTGKGLAALLVHRGSRRSKRPLVSVNCAAIPDELVESELFGYNKGAFTGADQDKIGRFEMANYGTLFLDEIGDMGAYAQAKILKIIEERENTRLGAKNSVPLDIRFIAATNVACDDLLSVRNFRKDLYYRINVARIHLPPLRERKEDIPRLVSHNLKTLNQRFRGNIQGVSDEAINAMLSYDWPGNVRELKNILEGAYIVADHSSIQIKDFPPHLFEADSGTQIMKNERDNLVSILESTNWNKTLAATKMNCSRMTLYRKMAKYGIA